MMRKPAARKTRAAQVKRFPAPVKGWIANQNLAIAEPQGAAILENWFPTATGARLRAGNARYATLPSEDGPVTALFTYANGANQSMFAANATDVYDITVSTAPVDALIAGGEGDTLIDDLGNDIGFRSVDDPVITGMAGGEWISVQFATPGGVFLRLVNGADTPRVYDGTSFDTSPAIANVAGGASTLSYVWAFKNRLWFIKKESLDAYYLPVDTIGGDAVVFPLGAVFQLGGSLLFGASWSLNENSGLSASNVFVTTEGEVAVYQGSDPGSASDWRLTGIYRIGRPLGPNAFIRAGGDLVIATEIGFVPLSQAIQKDIAALSPFSASYPIETEWNRAVAERVGYWSTLLWPTAQMIIVAPPQTSGRRKEHFVANARTGAWAPFTGQDIRCMTTFQGRGFYGGADGRIVEMEVTGADEDAVYTGIYVPLFDDDRKGSQLKTALMARAVTIAPTAPQERIDFLSDYVVSLSPAPNAAQQIGASAWGVGTWGEAVWGQSAERKSYQNWQSVGGVGYAVSVGVQISSGSITPPDIDLVRVELTMDVGDIVS